MDKEEAMKLLKNYKVTGKRITWAKGLAAEYADSTTDDKIVLDGDFDVDTLEAIVWVMRNG